VSRSSTVLVVVNKTNGGARFNIVDSHGNASGWTRTMLTSYDNEHSFRNALKDIVGVEQGVNGIDRQGCVFTKESTPEIDAIAECAERMGMVEAAAHTRQLEREEAAAVGEFATCMFTDIWICSPCYSE
jgi:hypothetical protein